MATAPSTDEQTTMILDELRAIRKSVDRVFLVLLVPIVLVGLMFLVTILRALFPPLMFW